MGATAAAAKPGDYFGGMKVWLTLLKTGSASERARRHGWPRHNGR